MRQRSHLISILLSTTAILWLVFSSCAFAEDVFAMKGEALSEQEMSEARGGFALPGGDFLYFSMDLLKLDFLSHNEPITGNSGWVNALTQKVTITENGKIGVDLGVLQGQGSQPAGESNSAASNAATNNTAPSNAVVGNTAPSNAVVGNTAPSNAVVGNTAPKQIDVVNISDSFKNYTGLGSANIVTGNYNTASIINVLNVRVGFFSRENVSIGDLKNFLQY